jgi:23S rRNA (adenine2503-C2)-methyltransferase
VEFKEFPGLSPRNPKGIPEGKGISQGLDVWYNTLVDKDLKSKTVEEIEHLVVEYDQKKYNAGYIFGFIHTRGITDISGITPLSKPFRSRLVEDDYYISKLEVIDKLTDPDGTVKYVFGLPDEKPSEISKKFRGPSPGNPLDFSGRVESVLLFDGGRRTLCVSTQVGCAMGCVFCATGKLGLARNLTTAEIVDQVNIVEALDGCDARFVKRRTLDATDTSCATDRRITNVVFMGMGEPLANYDAVLNAVRILNHPAGRKIGIRRITISTCGLPEQIERLAEEDISPRLAISLNAPTDAIRQRLMPITAKYSLGRLMRAVELYQHKTRNRVTFEYVLIKGVNDTVTHAKMLIKRLRPFMCNVNLIEYNPHPGCPGFSASSREAIKRFAQVLSDAGIETTVRLKMGQTINAACGQLGAQGL